MDKHEYQLKLFQMYSNKIISKQSYECLTGLINEEVLTFDCSFDDKGNALKINLSLTYKTNEDYLA